VCVKNFIIIHIYNLLYGEFEVKSRMTKIKNLAYGMVFGLVIFGLVMMSTGITTGSQISSRERSWETEESGAWGVAVGAKGVSVEYWREYEDEHGAHLASAVRPEFFDTGYADWWSMDRADTSSDRHSSAGANYYWDVEEFSFCPETGHSTHQGTDGIAHTWRLDYEVTEERDTWWPWGDYEKEYEDTISVHMYASSDGGIR